MLVMRCEHRCPYVLLLLGFAYLCTLFLKHIYLGVIRFLFVVFVKKL